MCYVYTNTVPFYEINRWTTIYHWHFSTRKKLLRKLSKISQCDFLPDSLTFCFSLVFVVLMQTYAYYKFTVLMPSAIATAWFGKSKLYIKMKQIKWSDRNDQKFSVCYKCSNTLCETIFLRTKKCKQAKLIGRPYQIEWLKIIISSETEHWLNCWLKGI